MDGADFKKRMKRGPVAKQLPPWLQAKQKDGENSDANSSGDPKKDAKKAAIKKRMEEMKKKKGAKK